MSHKMKNSKTEMELVSKANLLTASRGSASKLFLLIPEQDIESRHRAVGAGDVLVHFDFLAVGKFFVGVNFLLQDPKIVPDHHDFVKENLQRDFFCLQ